jgi:hypothetical protein
MIQAAALKKTQQQSYRLSTVSVKIKDESKLSCDELFESPRIVKAANRLSDYLQDKDL